MNLRTLLVWGMAASALAACSGGSGSVLGGGTQPGSASLQLDTSQLQSRSRTPQFVATSVNTVAYVFNPGNISGSVALSTCPKAGGVYTCTVSLVPNTYSLSVTLEKNATPIGNGSAANVVVLAGATTSVPMPINPVNGGPALSVPTNSQFYVDGTTQTITATVNELDPVGDIITTFYGPVSNYPTLTFTGSGGTTGVTINGGNTITSAPGGQSGGTAPIAFNGLGVNANSLGVNVSDGTTSSSVITIPFISLASAGCTSPCNLPTSGGLPITFTEGSSAGGVPVFDTKLYSGTNCGAAVNFSPTLAGAPFGNTLTANAVTITATATGTSIGSPSCTITVLSPEDPNLAVTLTLNLPSGVNGSITSVGRSGSL